MVHEKYPSRRAYYFVIDMETLESRIGRYHSMQRNLLNILQSLSLLVIGISTIVLTGSRLFKADLPDMVTRICGILDMIGLFVLVFTMVTRFIKS